MEETCLLHSSELSKSKHLPESGRLNLYRFKNGRVPVHTCSPASDGIKRLRHGESGERAEDGLRCALSEFIW